MNIFIYVLMATSVVLVTSQTQTMTSRTPMSSSRTQMTTSRKLVSTFREPAIIRPCICSSRYRPVCAGGRSFGSSCLLDCENVRRRQFNLTGLSIRCHSDCESCGKPILRDTSLSPQFPYQYLGSSELT